MSHSIGYQIAISFGLCYVAEACGGKGRELGRGYSDVVGYVGLVVILYILIGRNYCIIYGVMYFCIVIV
jgi:hypothetical protein